MAPATILERLWCKGVTVSLMDDRNLLVAPSSKLREADRELLRANKPEIVAFLRESNDVASEMMVALLAAAMRRCDQFGDDEAARAEMRADCMATPPELRADLLAHFQESQDQMPPEQST